MADEHSLDSQRFFNIVCWVYGRDPERHADMVDDERYLPNDRAEVCPEEWATLERSWTTLLSPHMRE